MDVLRHDIDRKKAGFSQAMTPSRDHDWQIFVSEQHPEVGLIMSSGSVFPITRIESQLYQADRFNNGSPSFDQAGFDCYDDLRRRVVKYPQPNSKCATMGFPTKRRELPPWHRTLQCQGDSLDGGKGWPVAAGQNHAQKVNNPPSEGNVSQEKHLAPL